MNKPTCFPDTTGPLANILDPFYSFCFEKSSAELLPPLATSDHSLINVKVDAKPKASSDVPFHRMIFSYTKADCDSLISYITEVSLSAFLKKNVTSMTVSFVYELIPSAVESFIQQKNNKSRIARMCCKRSIP